jgi:hypothetical protein
MQDEIRSAMLARARRVIQHLETLAEIIEQPTAAAAVVADAVAAVDRVCAALETPDKERNMHLVDAVALAAEFRRQGVAITGEGWGFAPQAFRAAVDAWLASDEHPKRGPGRGRAPAKWKHVAAALRSAGASPPDADTLRRQHEDWRRDRARRPAS